MCGILAILGGPLPVDSAVAEAALDLQAHRGPDDTGTWHSDRAWLGARRLAILDTSTRGHQPMVDKATGVVVVFNGEIYNYLELREELREAGDLFRSGADTEVVLRSYLRWGRDCLARFNGMWGLCLFDPRDMTAFVARDRLGVKPVYLTAARHRVSVASEAKSLLHLYPELRRVDEEALFRFLSRTQLHVDERSFYDGIQVLPPAHAASVDLNSGRLRTWRYWRLDAEAAALDDGEVLERFGATFEDAVRLRMRSDVPVGVTLSGGLDSTAVTHAAASTLLPGASLRAFTSVWDAAPRSASRDEAPWARLVASRYGQVDLEEVPAAEADWLQTLERIAWHLDAPNLSPAVIPLWSIMARAREAGVKVMLEGQGADELLGGYVHHAAVSLLAAVRGRNGTRSDAFGAARGYSRTFSPSTFWLWVVREALPFTRGLYRARRGTSSTLRREFADRSREVADTPPPSVELAERLVNDLTRDILPAFLHYGDAVSMAHSVESRQPFLDYRLVELATALPASWKVSRGETKVVLRQYLHAIGHEQVAARPDKRGFPTPIWQWLAYDDAAVPQRLLLGPDSRILRYCSERAVRRLVEHTQRHPRSGAFHLYRLVSSELWLRACIG